MNASQTSPVGADRSRPSMAEYFAQNPQAEREPVITLRLTLSPSERVLVRAWLGPLECHVGRHVTHRRLYCELRRGWSTKGPALFPRNDRFTVAYPLSTKLETEMAKELVLSLFALKPGDTDSEFFEGESAEQLAFRSMWGDELTMIAEERFGVPE